MQNDKIKYISASSLAELESAVNVQAMQRPLYDMNDSAWVCYGPPVVHPGGWVQCMVIKVF
jgi:hypothetical protein